MTFKSNIIKNIIYSILLLFAANYYVISVIAGKKPSVPIIIVLFLILLLYSIFINNKSKDKRLSILKAGNNLLLIFIGFVCIEVIFTVLLFVFTGELLFMDKILHCLLAVLGGFIVFWSGIIRVYFTSVQLGIKWRVIGVICGCIPIVNIWALARILKITLREIKTEEERAMINFQRSGGYLCKTKYPLLLVHGVFFRDSNFINYWGRIPGQLKKNGAEIFYGEHGSAAAISGSAIQLKERIEKIIKETGCQKINIIAHSKGGLDIRYAITHLGMDKYTASLTTVNTPHRGCQFADYLLEKISLKKQESIAGKYNRAAGLAGEKDPDFLEAVKGLTAASCSRFNESTPDMEGVYYQSIGTAMGKASSGKFPLNMSHLFVKKFDGKNDGLVSVESMKWGEKFHYIETDGRGVSHADIIDLHRENISGFDVSEFYVKILNELKEMGF